MIKIVTDSTSYIPENEIEKYDISIVSLNVVMNDNSQREVDIDENNFYLEMERLNVIPSSSQPSIEEMYNTFEKIVKDGNSVLAIFLSSEMSGTYSSAHMVKDMILENYPDAVIEIMDSRTNCMQMGFMAIEAAKAGALNKSMDEVKEIVTHIINNSRFLFTPHTLDYLIKGGRIGGASALIGQLLQIRPILTVVDGQTSVVTKVRTHKKAVDKIIDLFLEDIKDKELGDVIVHHINTASGGNELANRLEEKLGIQIQIQSIGPVIGLHVGPNSIGLAYYTK